MKNKIAIGPSTFAGNDSKIMQKLFSAGFDVVRNPYGRKLTKNELADILPGVTGLIAGLEQIDREIMEKSCLKVISRCGTGIDNIDLKAAGEFGIKIYSTPDAPVVSVAELTVGAMFCLLRSIHRMDNRFHNGEWPKTIGTQLKGKAIAIIGYGRIGRNVARLIKPFGVRILAVDQEIIEQSVDTQGIEFTGLENALTLADIISIHTSGNSEILGEREFRKMKEGIFLLNCSRGSAVNEDALISAIEKGKIAGAWMDVFSEEPYKGRLLGYEKVLLTPHVGSYTSQCRSLMEMEAVDNLMAGLREQFPEGEKDATRF